jgi:hypothetical protein
MVYFNTYILQITIEVLLIYDKSLLACCMQFFLAIRVPSAKPAANAWGVMQGRCLCRGRAFSTFDFLF